MEISFWKYFTIFMVIWKVQWVMSASHQSHLCEPTDMPCGNGDECRMKYYKLNSTHCRDLEFNNEPRTEKLGKFQLGSYHYSLKSYKQTGFNLSFTNITWTHLKFRFKQEGNDMKNTCREFYMAANSSIKNLFYDCLWSNENYEGKTFSLEYEARKGESFIYKKYLFRVPLAKHIEDTTELENWEIFVFVETVKNAFGLMTFIIHWQPLPERFDMNSYNLKVYTNTSGEEKVIYVANVSCYDGDDCKYYYNKWYGNVQFGIQPACGNNTICLVSKTGVFVLGGENTKPLLIGIVSVTVIIPAMIYVVYLLRSYLIRKSKKWACPVPKVLIVFTPSLSCHVNVVFALVEYLKLYCNVEPLVDEMHIFDSKSRDPFKWCNESLKSADVVMVVASPYYKHLRLAQSVYKNTDVLLLRLLRERLSSKDNKTRCFLLLFPYCSETDIPPEAANLRKFSFPEDLNKMLRFVHKDKSLPYCLVPEIRGGRETYKLLGGKLSSAIAEATANLKKNKKEYEKMVEEMKNEREEQEETILPSESNKKEEKKKKMEREAEMEKKREDSIDDMFLEFPGRIDDLNLSGDDDVEEEEGRSLMRSEKTSEDTDVINLDVLDL